MAYGLFGVKPHVVAAANYFGPKYGIKTIGGIGPGSVPGSDHPKGLALDFMTRSKTTGDALSSDVIANYSKWNVKYVIWWRRIWQPGKGWSSYSGPSAHTDHVHVSFNASGTAPADPGSGSVIPVGGNPLVPDGLEDAAKRVAAFSDWLSDPAVWRKVGFYMMGAGMILAGVLLLSLRSAGSLVGPAKIARTVSKVAK